MKIGLLCHHGLGGSARVAIGLAAELAARGHDVHLFARLAPLGMAQLPPGVTLHALSDVACPVTTRLDIGWAADELSALVERICAVVRREQLDVLHFHYAVPFAEVADGVRRRLGSRCPALIGTLHGTDVSVLGRRRKVRGRLAPALAGIDALTTVSRSHARLAVRLLGLVEPPRVIPNFVDLDRFAPATAPEARTRPRIVHVSNFRPVKQPASMARIVEDVFRATEAELWLVGDGEMMPAVESILAPRLISGQVRRLGVRLDVENIVPHTDLLLVTSRLESFCLVALEAAASGVPVVAPRIGGLPEIVEHGVNGFLFERDDEQGAARLILDYLADPGLQARMRAAARERAATMSSTAVIPCYERLYREVVDDVRAEPAVQASG